MRVILPAAGFGTRMIPVTGGSPKELLPLGDSTVIDRVVGECSRISNAEIVLVWREEKGKLDRPWQTVNQINKPGLAAAVASAFEPGEPSQDSLILLADTVFLPAIDLKILVEPDADFAVLTEQVPAEKVDRYGMVEQDNDGLITQILEKPHPSQTASRTAVSARYFFRANVVDLLRNEVGKWKSDKELGITPILNRAIQQGLTGIAVSLLPNTTRHDCGSPEGYATAKEAFKK